MIATTLTYIDADLVLVEKQRKVQVVVFYGPQCTRLQSHTNMNMNHL